MIIPKKLSCNRDSRVPKSVPSPQNPLKGDDFTSFDSYPVSFFLLKDQVDNIREKDKKKSGWEGVKKPRIILPKCK